MLYFSETGWTLPGILAVNAEFERDCDEDVYEQRIAGLAASIEKQDEEQNPTEQERWFNALRRLSYGDHYLTVLVDGAESAGDSNPWLPLFDANRVSSKRPRGDFLRLIAFALAGMALMLILVWLWEGTGLHQAWRHFFW